MLAPRRPLAILLLAACSAQGSDSTDQAPATAAPMISTPSPRYQDLLYRFPEALAVEDVDHPAEPITGPTPSFPEGPKAEQLEGTVRLRYVVTAAGTVDSASVSVVSATDARFEDAAVAAIRRWQFRPAERDRKPVDQWIEQTIRFSMVDDE